MKKILCLIDGLTQGGAERQIIGLSHLLGRKGYDVTLAKYTKGCFYSDLIHELSVHIIDLDCSNKLNKFAGVWKEIKRGRYNVVITYKPGPSMISCLLKMMGMKYKLIVSERNTSQGCSINEWLKFNVYRWSDAVVTNSHSQNVFICKYYSFLNKKTVTIPNYTDLDHFSPKECEDHKRMKILTSARISKQKNIMAYIEAVKILCTEGYDIEFIWYGDVQSGQEDYKEQCFKKVSELGLENTLLFVDATSDIVNAYRRCDVFCLPSLYEGYPNALCEAMSCGKPILCSNVCDNPFIVEDGNCGYLFNPNDVNDIVKKIEQMYHLSEKDRKKMGERSREIAEKKFLPESFVNRYINIIE